MEVCVRLIDDKKFLEIFYGYPPPPYRFRPGHDKELAAIKLSGSGT